MIDDTTLLSALRGEREVAEVCRAAGITETEFSTARDAFATKRLSRAGDFAAAVGSTVQILRDAAGVPHIYAASTPDLYFGLGFATAQDRLWQLDRLRRRAYGTQAEVLGPAYLRSDLIHRTVHIESIVTPEVDKLDPQMRAIVDSYVAGINRHIEACGTDLLPIEFAILDYEPEPFTVRDVLAILRGMWWSLNGRLESIVAAEAARFLPEGLLRDAFLTPEAPEVRIVPGSASLNGPHGGANGTSSSAGTGASGVTSAGAATGAASAAGTAGMGDATGSNNWAVSGRKTATGHALLASDPHQAFWLPSSWYEYALHGPEDDAAGAGHPGAPGLWWGTNGDVAWGLTNNAASQRDLYIETVHPQDPTRYKDGDTWRPFAEHRVTINIRGQAPSEHTILHTVRGPIVNHIIPSVDPAGDPPLSLRWIGQEHLDDVRALVNVTRARTATQFRNALRDWAIPAFNFSFADKDGRVTYQNAMRYPLRGRITRGYRDANNPQDTWQGYAPFDSLPRLEDPARGYVASANNRVAEDDYPAPLHGAWAAGHRAARLEQHLSSIDSFGETRARTIQLQLDTKSTRAERLVPPLLNLLTAAQSGLAGAKGTNRGQAAGSISLGDVPTSDSGRLSTVLGAGPQGAAAQSGGLASVPGAGSAGGGAAALATLHAVLSAWDYRYTLRSPAPLAFETFMRHWQKRVISEKFPELLHGLLAGQTSIAARLIETSDLDWFPDGLLSHIQSAAQDTLSSLIQHGGPTPNGWRWETVHLAHWKHPLSNEATAPLLDVGPLPVAGSGDTVCNTGTSPTFTADSGAEYRLIVDFSVPDHFWAIQNAGNSGQPASPHYRDQFPHWSAGHYHQISLTHPPTGQTTTLTPI